MFVWCVFRRFMMRPGRDSSVSRMASLARKAFRWQPFLEKRIGQHISEMTAENRLTAVHRLDAAKLYRLALDKGTKGARYHAVAEDGVPVREIAEAIDRGLDIPVVSMVPEEAAQHFGWLTPFWSFDMPASSAITQEQLGWKPTGPGLIADLDNMKYS